mgnify:CR=1 FL=1
MTRKNLWIAVLMILVLSCDKDDNTIEETPQGYNMLLIGNSFFKPYAEKLDDIAELAKFENHSSLLITRGGDNGRPINFWNDSNSNAHLQIKAALDQGDIDIFGMTAGHEPEDRTEGHRAWINYALQNNPNITIFIAIPQIDFPDPLAFIKPEKDASCIIKIILAKLTIPTFKIKISFLNK